MALNLLNVSDKATVQAPQLGDVQVTTGVSLYDKDFGSLGLSLACRVRHWQLLGSMLGYMYLWARVLTSIDGDEGVSLS